MGRRVLRRQENPRKRPVICGDSWEGGTEAEKTARGCREKKTMICAIHHPVPYTSATGRWCPPAHLT